MNCGVLCISELLHDERLNDELMKKSVNGLSFQQIIEAGSKHGYVFLGCKSDKIPETPFLMLRKRHYYLIKERMNNCYLLYDPNLGYLKIPAWIFKRFYSGCYLVVL